MLLEDSADCIKAINADQQSLHIIAFRQLPQHAACARNHASVLEVLLHGIHHEVHSICLAHLHSTAAASAEFIPPVWQPFVHHIRCRSTAQQGAHSDANLVVGAELLQS